MSWKLVSLGSLLAVLALSGCSTPSSDQESATTPTAHTRCDRPGWQPLRSVRRRSEQARVKAGAQTARILGPNDVMTLEYRSDRLNLNADGNAVITQQLRQSGSQACSRHKKPRHLTASCSKEIYSGRTCAACIPFGLSQ